MDKKRLNFIVLCGALLLGLLSAYLSNDPDPQDEPFIATQIVPILTAAREQHILYGDAKGGGHHHTANRPCKSEFPEDWSEEAIISTVKKLAANDNAHWQKEDNGYYVSEQKYQTLKLRIVLNQSRERIITAYPTNVKRNPCY